MYIVKFVSITLLLAFIFPFTSTTAQAAPAKKITPLQAKVMYDQSATYTKAWSISSPIQISRTLNYGSKVLERHIVTQDSKKVVKDEFVGSSRGVAFYDGEWIYNSGSMGSITPYGMEIATKLGLYTNAEYSRYSSKSLTSYNYDAGGSAILRVQPFVGDFGFHFLRNKPICTTSVKSKEQLLFCRYYVEHKDNVKKKSNEITYTINSDGRLIKVVELFFNGNKETTTYISYKNLITLPVGPFLDYDLVLNNPEYKYTTDLEDVKFEFSRIVGHLKFVGTTAGRDRPNLDDWKLIAREYDLSMYDKGVGYTVRLGLPERVKICIVFTEEGGRLELVSCESLGFIHPY